MEYILWGTPKGAKSWEEEVLVETKSTETLEKAKSEAAKKGYTNLRVLNYNGEAPDFKGTVRR